MLIKFVSDGFKFGESKILISNQGQTLYFNFSSIGAILIIQEEKLVLYIKEGDGLFVFLK